MGGHLNSVHQIPSYYLYFLFTVFHCYPYSWVVLCAILPIFWFLIKEQSIVNKKMVKNSSWKEKHSLTSYPSVKASTESSLPSSSSSYTHFHHWELKDEYDKFMELQKKRKLRVQEVCKKYNMTKRVLKEVTFSLVADNNEKFIFCNNYKVGNNCRYSVVLEIKKKWSSRLI